MFLQNSTTKILLDPAQQSVIKAKPVQCVQQQKTVAGGNLVL